MKTKSQKAKVQKPKTAVKKLDKSTQKSMFAGYNPRLCTRLPIDMID